MSILIELVDDDVWFQFVEDVVAEQVEDDFYFDFVQDEVYRNA